MAILSNVVLGLSILVAIVFSLLVLITGKGDAMSGGGSVRTSYKGKATFDDIMSRATLYLGISFMVLVLVYNVVSTRALNASTTYRPPTTNSEPPVTNNAPAINAPLSNNNAAANTASNNSAANTATSTSPANNNTAANTPPANSNTAANTPPANNAPVSNNAPAANNTSK